MSIQYAIDRLANTVKCPKCNAEPGQKCPDGAPHRARHHFWATSVSDELEVRVAKALFRFEQCDREQAKDVDGGWISRLDSQDRAEYLGMAREAIHEAHVDADQAVAIEREAAAGWLESKAEWLNANDIEWRSREVTRVAHLIRNGEHVKP